MILTEHTIPRFSTRPNSRKNIWNDLLPVDMEPREREQYQFGRQKNMPSKNFNVKITSPPVGVKLVPILALQWLHRMQTIEDFVAVLTVVAKTSIYRPNSLRMTAAGICIRKMSEFPPDALVPHALALSAGFNALDERFVQQKIVPLVLKRLQDVHVCAEERTRLVLAVLRSQVVTTASLGDALSAIPLHEVADELKCDLLEAVVAQGFRHAQFLAAVEAQVANLSTRSLTLLLQAKMHFALVGKDDAEIARTLWSKVKELSLPTVNVLTAFADEHMLNDAKFQRLVQKLKTDLPDLDQGRIGVIGSVLDM
jgi:hypothetical protein